MYGNGGMDLSSQNVSACHLIKRLVIELFFEGMREKGGGTYPSSQNVWACHLIKRLVIELYFEGEREKGGGDIPITAKRLFVPFDQKVGNRIILWGGGGREKGETRHCRTSRRAIQSKGRYQNLCFVEERRWLGRHTRYVITSWCAFWSKSW